MNWPLWKKSSNTDPATPWSGELPRKPPGCSDSISLHPVIQKFADTLGECRRPLAPPRESESTHGPHVIAIGSGKGGVGKTLVSSSIALALAEHCGRRIVAIDADLGGANLHTGLGIKRPSFALNQFIMDKKPLRVLTGSSGFDGLELVSGASDIIGLAEFTGVDRARFLEELRTFREDTIVVDLGAGSSLFNLDLFCTAHQGILITTTEPTAVQNAYGFLRAAIYRRLRLLYQADDRLLHMIEGAANHRRRESGESIPRLIWQVSRFNRPAACRLEEIIRQLRIGLVVNMAKTREATRVADALVKTVRQHLGVHMDFLGSVDLDTSVRRSVCEWRPLVVHFPTAKAARRLVAVAAKVGSRIEDASRSHRASS